MISCKMAVYVIFISIFFLQIAIGEKQLKPTVKCIPTAAILGPEHVCVCHTDGIFHCRERTHHELKQNEIQKPRRHECEPNQLYRQDSFFCSCTSTGFWRSITCREHFHQLVLQKDHVKKNIRTNIECEPNKLYITDCNICVCSSNGLINFNFCTTRRCPKRNRSDFCNPNEVYRSAREFCVCSIVNYYVDRLCLSVDEDVVQAVSTSDLSRIFDIGIAYSSIDEISCQNNETFTIDCNTCTCLGKYYVCTSKVCFDVENALRNFVDEEKIEMPEIMSIYDNCIPGKKYKFKCNTCMCNRKGSPVCTSMICLQDLLVDSTVLRQMIVSY